jgi:Neutral/alkaline non-lysosomal ceramidase, N-terminal
MALAVSSAKTDITPTLAENPYMGGFAADQPREATGTQSPLYVRCLIFWDDGFPNAIVVADVLAFARPLHQAIHQQVLALNSDWAYSDVILAAQHTHNGPVLPGELDPYISYNITDLSLVNNYATSLQTKIVDVVQAALDATRTPCTLDYKVASQGFSYNREGLPYQETAVPVLVARKSNGQPAAVLFSYGTHPVTAGAQSTWDGDYPALACSVIEAAIPGCFALFVLGPDGDQNPMGAADWSLCTLHGTSLGNAVVSATGSPGRMVGGPIRTHFEDVSLPLDVTDAPENLAAVRAIYQVRRDNAGFGFYRRHAELMLQEIDNHDFATEVPLPVHVWKLQGSPILRIALTGGELVSGYAVYLRNLYGGPGGILVGGCAGEVPSYVPSDELLPPIRSNGSYAGGWDPDSPGIAGGSMTVYRQIGHLRAGTGGAESKLIAALTSALA